MIEFEILSENNPVSGSNFRGGGVHLLPVVVLVSLLTAVTPLAAANPEFHDHRSIRDAAASFLAEKAGGNAARPDITVGQLDKRLNLAACQSKLETFLPPGSRLTGNVTVGVRCAEPKPWTIYVPASVRVFEKIIVTNRVLTRGEIVNKNDLAFAEMDVATLGGGYIQDIESVLGKQLKSSLGKGVAVTPRVLEAPRLVRRGERVTITARADGIDVRMAGKALMDGTAGERIRVRNINSDRVIEATVASPGMVEVQM